MSDISPEVMAFARAMQFKLDKNAHKSGWETYDDEGKRKWDNGMIAFLQDKLLEEVDELQEAMESGTAEEVVQEAADVGNLAMMIADCYGLIIS